MPADGKGGCPAHARALSAAEPVQATRTAVAEGAAEAEAAEEAAEVERGMPEAAGAVALVAAEAAAKAPAATAVAAAAFEDARQQEEAAGIRERLGEMGLGMYAERLLGQGWDCFEVRGGLAPAATPSSRLSFPHPPLRVAPSLRPYTLFLHSHPTPPHPTPPHPSIYIPVRGNKPLSESPPLPPAHDSKRGIVEPAAPADLRLELGVRRGHACRIMARLSSLLLAAGTGPAGVAGRGPAGPT
jgi:hypothetical protein